MHYIKKEFSPFNSTPQTAEGRSDRSNFCLQTAEGRRGRVYIIGAGPGASGLITCRGKELLQNCDAVVYDDLIPWELITSLPRDVQRHYVGKRGGRISIKQDEINRLMVELAAAGLNVVRLKGGDPLVFGRLGEELDYLRAAGVEIEVIPGVTAVAAAAASIECSLTDRRTASWLTLATGHSADSDSPPVPWRDIARMEDGNLAVYMGLAALEEITADLLSGGMPPSMPAAVISRIGSAGQCEIYGHLDDIALKVRQAGLESPAIVLIGRPFTSLRDASRLVKPLDGKRALVTRPACQNERLCRMLRDLGAEPLPLPTIYIEPADDSTGWDCFQSAVETGGWLVFTGQAGAEHFLSRLLAYGMDIRSLGKFSIAAIGSGTESALRRFGLKADLIPDKFTRQGLVEALLHSADLSGVNIVRVRGNLGDDLVERELARAGAKVIVLTVYRTEFEVWDAHIKDEIIAHPPDYITFTSSSTVEGLVKIIGIEDARRLAKESKVAVIGPITAATAREFGLPVALISSHHTEEGLVETLVKDCEAGKIG